MVHWFRKYFYVHFSIWQRLVFVRVGLSDNRKHLPLDSGHLSQYSFNLNANIALYISQKSEDLLQSTYFEIILVFQNEVIFVQLDELDKLDRITHAWMAFNYILTQAQKTF